MKVTCEVHSLQPCGSIERSFVFRASYVDVVIYTYVLIEISNENVSATFRRFCHVTVIEQ